MEGSYVNELRTPPAASRAARHFNLAVAALCFLLMLSFAVWLGLTAVAGGNDRAPNFARAVAGTLILAASVTLLRSVADEWRSGEPFQQSRTTLLGIALLGLGTTILALG